MSDVMLDICLDRNSSNSLGIEIGERCVGVS